MMVHVHTTTVVQFAQWERCGREDKSMFWHVCVHVQLTQIVGYVTSVGGSYFSNYISTKWKFKLTSTYIAKKVSTQLCFGTFW